MKETAVEVEIKFKGTVYVRGDVPTEEKAVQIVKDDFAAVLGKIHSSNDWVIVDWDFSTHPDEMQFHCK